MTEHHNTTMETVRVALSYIAALLGVGTFAGFVSVGVGVLSGMWLAYQLYVAIKYDLPIKRAKLAAIRLNKEFDSTFKDELK